MFNEVIHFWFDEVDSKLWWEKNLSFDLLIAQRFSDLHAQAAAGELFAWRETALGCLAEILLLDQFSRNMFRDTAQSFYYDAQALTLSQSAVARGLDKALTAIQRSFLYMPYMHSESYIIHQQAEKLFEANGIISSWEFELKHKQIIERFGRYPHRNLILSRHSTDEEEQFLMLPGSYF